MQSRLQVVQKLMKRTLDSDTGLEIPEAKKRLALDPEESLPIRLTYEGANEEECTRCTQINALLSVMEEQYHSLHDSHVCVGLVTCENGNPAIPTVDFVVEKISFRVDPLHKYFENGGWVFVLPTCEVVCKDWSEVSKTAAILEPTVRLLFLDLVLKKVKRRVTKIGQFYEAANRITTAISNALGENWCELAQAGTFRLISPAYRYLPRCQITTLTRRSKQFISISHFLVSMIDAIFTKYRFNPMHWRSPL